jgi:hypothetical protein
MATPAETEPLKAGVGWVAKHWPRTRLAHEGMMLEKINRQNRIVETLARNTMTGDTADVTGWPGNEGDDAMGVNIGDHIHYHQALSEQTETPAAAAAETPLKLSTWLPYLVAAATAIGGYYAGQKTETAVVQPPAVNVDKDAYGIELQHYIPK